MQKLAIASDHAGFELKGIIKDAFGSEVEWLDLGAYSAESVNYAEYGHLMARAIMDGKAERGILICGTGIGISIAANRHKGVRAALCCDVTMARMARLHNDANVLALGARIIGREVAIDCARVFMQTDYEGGRHKARVQSIDTIC